MDKSKLEKIINFIVGIVELYRDIFLVEEEPEYTGGAGGTGGTGDYEQRSDQEFCIKAGNVETVDD